MKEIFPRYYQKFKCIAGECRHSCCIGWEIDIDEDTYELYQSLNSPMGEKIRTHIEGEPPHFVLGEGKRCPFLDEDGLCEIIREHGDGALCDICYLHPRFSNEYDTFTETGLGLCCEEAARIILSEEAPFSVRRPLWMSRKERRFFKAQKAVLKVLQDRRRSFQKRLDILAEAYRISLPTDKALVAEFLSLERLDEAWTEALACQGDLQKEVLLEQFGVYLIFRHWAEAWADEDYAKVVRMVIKSCRLLATIATDEDFLALARMYSSEVEYSTENLEKLMECY